MGLLDTAFLGDTSGSGVPSLQKLDGDLFNDSLVNYNTVGADTLANESFSAVQSTYGNTLPFSALSTDAPTFSSLSASAQLGNISTTNPYYMTANALPVITSSDVSAQQVNASGAGAQQANNSNHKVRVSTADGSELVEFDIMPEVTETRSVEYEAIAPPQMPGEFQKYKGTKSTAWQISAMLICRTRQEAARNLGFINILRGWTEPYFGEKQNVSVNISAANDFGAGSSSKLGAPPPVLTFTGWRTLIGPVPVVMSNLNWTWPKDCNWIPTGQFDAHGQELPFPTVMNITLSLTESFSAQQFNGFDLVAFKSGNMVGAFAVLAATSDSVQRSEPTGGNQGITNGTPQSLPIATYSNEGKNYKKPAAQSVDPSQSDSFGGALYDALHPNATGLNPDPNAQPQFGV